jgi:hypothetical protein
MPYKDKEKQKEYYQKNKDRIKKYYEDNKEHRKEYDREYRKSNKEGRPEYDKGYYQSNKIRIRDRRRVYQSKKRGEGGYFKLIMDLRTRQGKVLKGRISTTKGLGCTSIQLQAHIEGLFTDGMNLSNHGRGAGKWHLDHIIPLASYQRDTSGGWDIHSEYNKKLVHYTNLRPMWEEDNLEKSDNIDENDLIIFLERKI